MHRGTVLAQDNRSDGYSHQYTYDKLTNIVLAGFEVNIANHLDADGYCCTFNESRSAVADQRRARRAAQPASLRTNPSRSSTAPAST